jgi:predicted TIM-barrel fold metal-dependent hydrolase
VQVIDTHTHFYDPERPEGVPWPPRDNQTLYRRVLPQHFRDVAGPVGVSKTVVVEASNRIEDNDWILHLAERDESIVGFVGNLDVGSAGFADALARYAGNPLFRGIRAHPSAIAVLVEPPAVGNLAALAELDLALDLLAHPADLLAVASLAEALPGLRIVLDHVAHVPIDGKTPDEGWKRGIEAVAGRRNVFCKLSGLTEAAVERPAPTDPSYYAPTIAFLFDALGAERLMYASNWPVCELASDYETGFRVVEAFLAGRSADERDHVWTKTARAVYRLS